MRLANAIAIPIDSALFVLIAFVGDLPGAVIWEILWLNVAFKGAFTLISLPWIYLVKPGGGDSTPIPRA